MILIQADCQYHYVERYTMRCAQRMQKSFLFLLLVCFCLAPIRHDDLPDAKSSLRKESKGQKQSGHKRPSDGTPLKKVLDLRYAGDPASHRAGLKPNAWKPWQKGFKRQGNVFICDNGTDAQVQRGVSQAVILNQTKPEPIVAVAWSKAEGVGGGRNSDYSLYLDLLYSDGTPLWGQIDPYNVGTHDWEKAQVIVFPEKPVKSVSFHMLLRRHPGKAWFRNPQFAVIRPPMGACLFDGVPVSLTSPAKKGFRNSLP